MTDQEATPETLPPMRPRDLLWMAEAKSTLSPEMRQHLRNAHDAWDADRARLLEVGRAAKELLDADDELSWGFYDPVHAEAAPARFLAALTALHRLVGGG